MIRLEQLLRWNRVEHENMEAPRIERIRIGSANDEDLHIVPGVNRNEFGTTICAVCGEILENDGRAAIVRRRRQAAGVHMACTFTAYGTRRTELNDILRMADNRRRWNS